MQKIKNNELFQKKNVELINKGADRETDGQTTAIL